LLLSAPEPAPFFALLAPLLLVSPTTHAQLGYERLLHASDEPQNWLTYSGSYASQRYSALDEIRPGNVDNLELAWVFQAQSLEAFETSPLVVDGIMYLTEAPNTAVALDARSGRLFWRYQYDPAPEGRPCCGRVNRGLAMLGDTLYMATIDSKLIAIDAKLGKPLWQVQIGDPAVGYSMTLAPLAVKDKVIVGVGGGEYGIRGFLSAYAAATGKELWRFYTIPAPGEPGSETWAGGGDAWMHGGGPIWITGSYDAELGLTYWGVGNPGPDWAPAQRPGDNLYSDSVIALDPDTGELKWHFQFTPHDGHDYDATQVPVLVDLPTATASSGKLMLWGNRNGFFYVLDRVTGEFVRGNAFVKVNWASGLDESGRPIMTPVPPGQATYPGNQGGTNWYSPSYSPRTRLFYLNAWENYASVYQPDDEPTPYVPGKTFAGGFPAGPVPGRTTLPGIRRGPINDWTAAAGRGVVLAIDPVSGESRWRFETTDVSSSGVLTTASDLLFTGTRDGYFYALDARTGELLWRATVGGQGANGPISYAVGGKQYVAAASGHSLFVFTLRE
jgi:alcohol dehydrogenase (cytochrome c)